MADTTQFNLNDASLDDGTLDYYTLIQEPVDADAETLRSKIQSLYSEAQANRDHRNLTKRREYQALLDYLPRARTTLLEPEKRARYNAYLASVQNGTAEVPFEAFMQDLLGQDDGLDEKTGLLATQKSPQEPRARVIKAPVESAATPKTSVPQTSSPGMTTPLLGVVVGFLVGGAIGYLISGHKMVPAILIGVILAAIAFVVLNRQPRGGIRS